MPSFEEFLAAHPEQQELSHTEQVSNYEYYIETILMKYDY